MAGIAAYLSVKFLMRYFNEAKNRLDPYAYYCWTAGCLAFIGIVLRG
jgi:undecaprenyl-diphosphatase